jgi:hypothetical protein
MIADISPKNTPFSETNLEMDNRHDLTATAGKVHINHRSRWSQKDVYLNYP